MKMKNVFGFRQLGLCAFFIGAFFLIGNVATATTLNIDLIDGDWFDVSGGVNVNIVNSDDSGGTSTVSWGSGGTSSYVFTTTSTPIDVYTDGTAFALGSFTHNNYPINSGSGINSVYLDLEVADLGIYDIIADFYFDHNETPNSGSDPRDIVTIGNLVINYLFEYEGVDYYFNLLGFSQDCCNTFSSVYYTNENASNTTVLYAQITESPVGTPEPTTALLFGLGILGLAGVSRKKTA